MLKHLRHLMISISKKMISISMIDDDDADDVVRRTVDVISPCHM